MTDIRVIRRDAFEPGSHIITAAYLRDGKHLSYSVYVSKHDMEKNPNALKYAKADAVTALIMQE